MKLYSRFQKRLATFVTGSLLIASFSPAIMASDYEKHWAKDAIERWSDKEIIQGYEDGSFKPKQAITRGELAKIITEIFGLTNTSNAKKYVDVDEKAWYAPYVATISSAGIMNDEGKNFNPNQTATREEAAYAIANAYKVSKGTSNFKDSEQISKWASEKVGALAANGYIKGRTDGKFAPKDTLTRADVITMIDKITADLINKAGTYNKNIQGNLVVNTGDVILKDIVVSGNLYIAEGVGEGDITLDHVEVKGMVFLEGAGENTFKLINGSKIGKIQVNKSNGKPVRIYGDQKSEIQEIDILSKCIIEGLAQFNIVNLLDKVGLDIKSGKIEQINVSMNATINLSSSATIKNLILDAVTTLTGNGTIDFCKVNISGCKLSVIPKDTSFKDSKDTITLGSKEYNQSTISQASNSTSSNSSSSGSSSTSNSSSGNHHSSYYPNSNVTTSDSSINIEPEKKPIVVDNTASKKEIVDVSYQESIVVPEGISAEQVKALLPSNIVVIYGDGTSSEIACSWDELGSLTEGTKELKGKATLPEGSTDTQGKLNNLILKIIVEKHSLVGPASITILGEKTYIEPTQTALGVQVTFPQHVTTAGILHVQIGDLPAQTQKVTTDSALSIDITLNQIDQLPAGKQTIQAWFENGADKTTPISINIQKKAPSKMPTTVSSLTELEEAMKIASDELLTQFTVTASNLTFEQLKNYTINSNQTLAERLKTYGFKCTVDENNNLKSITLELKYKTMYEASKAYREPNYGYQISDTAQKVLDVAKAVIKEKVTDSMTKYEKEKAIHDYIVANTAYGVPVEDSTAPVYGVEGVLLDHSAVCQGYAETMKLFMDMLGIECHVVTGTGISKDGSEPHAWNLIQLDDNEWYHMDATWNDPTPDKAGRINYNYFNLTDAMIQKDHTIDSNRTYPVANGTKYFYYANSQASSYEEFDAIVDKLLKSENLSGEIFLSFNSDINTLTDRIGKAAGNNGINGEIKTQFDGAVITFSIEKK